MALSSRTFKCIGRVVASVLAMALLLQSTPVMAGPNPARQAALAHSLASSDQVLPSVSTSAGEAAPPSTALNAVSSLQTSQTPLTGITLSPGWNLVSIPRIPADTSPAAVLASIAGSYTAVYTYDGCDASDPWKLYDPAAPAESDLTAIDHTMGFWVQMTVTDMLDFTGATPSTTSIQLCQGWNVIGYPLQQPLSVSGALHSIAGKYERVFGHAGPILAEPWDLSARNAPGWVNDLAQMEPGRGYWVLATENTELIYREPGSPPTVRFNALTDGTEIFGPTTITGTIDAATSVDWVLEYRAEGDTSWVQFAAGDTITSNQVAGNFDTTLLLNDMYEIRVTATDSFGQQVSQIADVLVSGQQKLGIFSVSFIDLAIPVAGIPIEIVRTYDSRNKYKGDFGVGWTLDIRRGVYKNNRKPGDGWFIKPADDFLHTPCSISTETKHHVTQIRLSEAEIYRFALQVQMFGFDSATQGGCLGEAHFVQVDGRLGASLDILGPIDVFWLGGDQLLDWDTLESYEPQNVRLTTADGREFDLTLAEGIGRIRDRNSNTLTINRNGIVHSSGKSITFARDSQDRITRVTDPNGDAIDYAYDMNEDLISVTDRERNVTHFTYDDNHALLDIIDPRGIPVNRNEYNAEGRLIAVIDGNGQRIEFTHDLDAQREAVRDRHGNVTIYEYDERGNVITKIDALKNTSRFTYDNDDNLLTETDPLGRTSTSTYDERGNVLSVVDFEGDQSTFTYNGHNQLLTFSDSRGRTITREYDASGNLIKSTDGEGATTQYTYDSAGNPLSMTDPTGKVTNYTYDPSGNLTSVLGPSGDRKTFTYDANGRTLTISTVQTQADGSKQTLTRRFEYDGLDHITRSTDRLGGEFVVTNNAMGKPIMSVDKNGNMIRYGYESLGYLSHITYTDGTNNIYTYDEEGRSITETDRDGYTTAWQYDALGRRTAMIYPDDTSTRFTYDPVGRILSETDERGNITTFGYALHTEIMTNTLDQATVQRFDSDGNLVQITDANHHTTSFTYDKGSQSPHGGGRLIATTFADGTELNLTYDTAGRKISQTDQADVQTRFAYDAVGNLIAVTDALGNKTQYTYDELRNLTSYTDANGHTNRFAYDGLGRVIKRTLPGGEFETFVYDAVGHVIGHTDFNGQTTTFAYDNNHRLVRRTLPDGTVDTFDYTSEGLRTQAGGDQYTYDERGRLLTEAKASGEVLSYTYDAAGNRTSVTTSKGTVTYTYDSENLLASVIDYDGSITSYAYDAVGNLLQVTMPNGTVTSYTYDSLNRLTALDVRDANGALLAAYTYTRAQTGHITRVVEGHRDRTVDYTYDALYRLTAEKITEVGSISTISYTYDAAGNRLTKTSTEGVTTYTYDENDRLITESGPQGTTSYTYDDNGNLIRTQGPGINITYTYDGLNHLIARDDGTKRVGNVYDADGIRVQRIVNGTDITNFLVDKNLPYAQVLQESNEEGAELASYVYGIDLLSMERPSTGKSYYHYDGQRSTRLLTDQAGTISDMYTFDGFGEVLAQTGLTTNNYLFAGEQFDSVLGFYYLRARYYDPSTGRFTSRDPFEGLNLENPITLHRYLYAESDPINKRDPSGREISLFGLVVGIAIIVALVGVAIWGYSRWEKHAKMKNIIVHARNMAHQQYVGDWTVNYEMWFGKRSDKRELHVFEAYFKIWSATVSIEWRDGKKTSAECYGPDVVARTWPEDGKIFFVVCDPFWDQPDLGLDSKAATIVHELSHDVGYALRLPEVYGVENAQNLAKTDPDAAIHNAANYAYKASEGYK